MKRLLLIGLLLICNIAAVRAQATKPAADSAAWIRMYCATRESVNEPLYVIDGKVSKKGFNKLNPNDILRIDILKDSTAVLKYGEKARYGVVLLTTKKFKAKSKD